MQLLDLPPVLGAGGHQIDACGIDAAVAENVGKLCDILIQCVECPGEEFS